MNAKNDHIRQYIGVTTWHDAGYTGTRSVVLTGERFEGEDATEHGQNTRAALLEIAPDASVVYAPFPGAKNTSKEFLQTAQDTGANAMFLSMSVSAFNAKEFDDKIPERLFMAVSAGNNGDEKYNAYMKPAYVYGVGALEFRWSHIISGVPAPDAEMMITPAMYSSESELVDFGAPTNLYVEGWPIPFNGTSCSCPALVGLVALVNDFFIDKTGKPLTHKAMYQFLKDHSEDIYGDGKDVETGWGLPILPAPETIDIVKYQPDYVESKEENIMDYKKSYITENPYYLPSRTIPVKGLMLHSVGCPQPNPNVFVGLWNKGTCDYASVHGVIGDVETHICLPVFDSPGRACQGFHGGSGVNGSVNNTHIGVEMCEPSTIKYLYGGTFEVLDWDASVEFVEKTTWNAVKLFADLCKFHRLNPLEDGVIISHAEGAKRGIAGAHGDPDHLWRQLNMDWDMDRFRQEVYNMMNGLEDEDMTVERFEELWLEMRKGLQDNDCSTWSEDARNWSVSTGLIQGGGLDENGEPNYMWNDVLTREQMATLLFRFYNMIKAEG